MRNAAPNPAGKWPAAARGGSAGVRVGTGGPHERDPPVRPPATYGTCSWAPRTGACQPNGHPPGRLPPREHRGGPGIRCARRDPRLAVPPRTGRRRRRGGWCRPTGRPPSPRLHRWNRPCSRRMWGRTAGAAPGRAQYVSPREPGDREATSPPVGQEFRVDRRIRPVGARQFGEGPVVLQMARGKGSGDRGSAAVHVPLQRGSRGGGTSGAAAPLDRVSVPARVGGLAAARRPPLRRDRVPVRPKDIATRWHVAADPDAAAR